MLGHKAIVRTVSAAGLAALVSLAQTARADWADEAFDAMRSGNNRAAASVAEKHRKDAGLAAEVLLFGAHTLQWSRERDRNAAVRVKTDYPGLLNRVTLGEVELLQRLGEIGDPALTKYATALLDQAFGRVAGPEQVRRFPALLESLPPDRHSKAIAGLFSWLAGEREKVEQGRSLSPEVREAFSDRALIQSLARSLGAEPAMKDKALELLPKKFKGAVTAVAGTKTARDCLVAIEEPALEVLDGMKSELGPSLEPILGDIRVAKAVREARYPGSTWYSASGK